MIHVPAIYCGHGELTVHDIDLDTYLANSPVPGVVGPKQVKAAEALSSKVRA